MPLVTGFIICLVAWDCVKESCHFHFQHGNESDEESMPQRKRRSIMALSDDKDIASIKNVPLPQHKNVSNGLHHPSSVASLSSVNNMSPTKQSGRVRLYCENQPLTSSPTVRSHQEVDARPLQQLDMSACAWPSERQHFDKSANSNGTERSYSASAVRVADKQHSREQVSFPLQSDKDSVTDIIMHSLQRTDITTVSLYIYIYKF